MTVNDTLSGVKVIDLTSVVAGPLATQILAVMGAEVIKVERPPLGDDSRQLPPIIDGLGAVYRSYNRGKTSVMIDLQTSEGLEELYELLKTADVLVESWRPGKLAKLGLSFEDLHLRFPRLTYCSLSAFGSGPLGRDLPGYDPVIQALSGIMYMTGLPNAEPSRVPVSVVDISTGLWAAIAILGGISRRNRLGVGDKYEVTLLDVGMALQTNQILNYLGTGVIPEPRGSSFEMAAPYEAFRSSDGWVMIAAGNQRIFERLCYALDSQDLIDDTRFLTIATRVSNRSALHDYLEAATRQRSSAELEHLLVAAGVPASAINSLDAALRHPLVLERGILKSSVQGSFPVVRLPIEPLEPVPLSLADDELNSHDPMMGKDPTPAEDTSVPSESGESHL